MLWKKGSAPFKSKIFFILGIHGEIKISLDIDVCLTKHSIVQMIAK